MVSVTNKMANYYIGVQIAFILIGWLANAATGIHLNNIWTQIFIVQTLILTVNVVLLYRSLYILKNFPKIYLIPSLSLSTLIFLYQSVSIAWHGINLYQIPYHLAFLFSCIYAIYLITKIVSKRRITT